MWAVALVIGTCCLRSDGPMLSILILLLKILFFVSARCSVARLWQAVCSWSGLYVGATSSVVCAVWLVVSVLPFLRSCTDSRCVVLSVVIVVQMVCIMSKSSDTHIDENSVSCDCVSTIFLISLSQSVVICMVVFCFSGYNSR